LPENSPLENRVALITGSSRGIGKSIAERLAREGVRIILTASSKERLEKAEREIADSGGTVASIACDLSDRKSVVRLASEAGEVYGGLDILINNAGIGLSKPFEETTDEEWDRCLATNASAPFILCRECFSSLKKSDRAAIVNIGSVVGIKGYAQQAAYCASKHALVGFSKVLAQEVQPYGIRVHCVNPGGVDTDLISSMRPDLDRSGLMKPEEIAEIVAFLLIHRGNTVIDDLHLRRVSGDPWY
jgi:3-oxoacyl-[acyl-carrier protein] reductase